MNVSCNDCQDYRDKFCRGQGLVGQEQINKCIHMMATTLKGSFHIELEDDDYTVTIEHVSPCGIAHPHMFGVYKNSMNQMGRNYKVGSYNVAGGCTCDWSKLERF